MPCASSIRGCTVYVSRLIKKLSSDGFTVGGYYNEDCKDEEIIGSQMFDKWTWMQTAYLPFKIWKYLAETWPYRIVHSHFSLEGMSYLWFIKTFGRKKIVVTIHNSMNDNYWSQTNIINKFFLRRMLKSKDVTWITVSNQGKEQLRNFPISSYKLIKVIPAYIPKDIEPYIPLPDNLETYISNHNKIISFYGHSFMTNDNVDVYGFKDAIKMYAYLLGQVTETIGMVICISDTSETVAIQKIRKYAEELGVNLKIYWQLGAIPNIKSLWMKTHVYVRPTSTDGDSVAVREVLDEGSYVVASDVCKRPDRVICYSYSDIDDFTSKVLFALSKPVQRNGKKNYEPYKQMRQIYSQLLNGIKD